MHLPFEPVIFGVAINTHLILEYLAFFVGFHYYMYLRKPKKDVISSPNRSSIILGAIIGAFLGSRLMGFLENPFIDLTLESIILLFNIKTIMGGLFGGLLGVEITKKIIDEKHSSGDLFTLPILVGIFIGRIGCFLSGMKEFTYGTETTFFLGMNLGDGLSRHPTSLYELIYLVLLFSFLAKLRRRGNLENGLLFKIFMLMYFGFRFFIEFIKPNSFYILTLSSIQWLCIICFLYYRKTIIKMLKYAH